MPKHRPQIVLNGILIGAAVELAAIPFFGALSDRIGRRPVYLFGAIMTAAVAFPLFAALDGGSAVLIAVALTVAFAFSHGAMYAPQAAFMSELFDARVRYSGASLGAQLALGVRRRPGAVHRHRPPAGRLRPRRGRDVRHRARGRDDRRRARRQRDPSRRRRLRSSGTMD